MGTPVQIPQDIGIYEPPVATGALRQGEVLSQVVQVKLQSAEEENRPTVELVEHPFAVIVSQDCDLYWDFKARQENRQFSLPSVLFCEVVTAEELRGTPEIKSDIWKRIRQNQDERYQFLQAVPAEKDAQGLGLPELGLDFKRYFTIPTEEVYRQLGASAKRRCRLVTPYAEHLSNRFFQFQSRVALPAEHFSAPVA
jgi:hypothetical protein